jgi:hypothetical protein
MVLAGAFFDLLGVVVVVVIVGYVLGVHLTPQSLQRDHSHPAAQNCSMGAVLTKNQWSRPLPRPLIIPSVMRLATLADVRELIERHLPKQFRAKPTWR